MKMASAPSMAASRSVVKRRRPASVAGHQDVESRLEDRDLAALQALDLRCILVDADDLGAELGKAGTRHETHVACANHCNTHAAFSSGAAAAAGCLVVSGSVGVAPDDVAGGLPQVVALQRIGEVGLEEASLAAAVEPPAS